MEVIFDPRRDRHRAAVGPREVLMPCPATPLTPAEMHAQDPAEAPFDSMPAVRCTCGRPFNHPSGATSTRDCYTVGDDIAAGACVLVLASGLAAVCGPAWIAGAVWGAVGRLWRGGK
jgi:hypothetical protein